MGIFMTETVDATRRTGPSMSLASWNLRPSVRSPRGLATLASPSRRSSRILNHYFIPKDPPRAVDLGWEAGKGNRVTF